MAWHQTSMFATLSAILHLGNMEISDDKDGNAALGNNKHFQVDEVPICARAYWAQDTAVWF